MIHSLRYALDILAFESILFVCGSGMASPTDIPWKIHEELGARLAAEAFFGSDKHLNLFDYDEGISRNFTPPFLVFDGLTRPPAEGSFGVFAVNPWTGDVWNLWGCHRLSTARLRASQAAIRKRFSRTELKQYPGLHQLKPTCTVED